MPSVVIRFCIVGCALAVLVSACKAREEAPEPEPFVATPPPVPPVAPVLEPKPTTDQPPPEAIPEPPRAPPGWGLIEFPIPPPTEDQLTVHALAGYEVVAIYERPDIDARKLGYMRIGTRMRVTDKLDGPGCPKGFHGLPTGGFACASKGLVVEASPPYMKDPPPPPRIVEPLPYDYAYVRQFNTPMWWRVPTEAEYALAQVQRAAREVVRLAQTGAAGPAGTAASNIPQNVPPTAPTPESALAEGGAQPSLPSLDAPAQAPGSAAGDTDGAPPVAAPSPSQPGASPTGSEGLAEPPPPPLPLSPDTPWLEKGFFLSVATKFEELGKKWWRTARGGIVEAKQTTAYAAKDFAGVELDERMKFPLGAVMAKEGKLFELDDKGKLKLVKTVERRTWLALGEPTEIEGKAYFLTTDGLLVPQSVMRIPDLVEKPSGLEPWERWIDVSIGKQMLVAYEGSQPVYVTLVSTGKKGTEEEPFETPTGRWRIQRKHVTTTMDGNTASDGNYSIQDVPWAMFFEGNYAIHGAFWHQGFGYVRSHGCINVGPTDARWLFFWTAPTLPSQWHGVHAQSLNMGTTVVVRE